jgi:sugar phosphate isomerase/epimerase
MDVYLSSNCLFGDSINAIAETMVRDGVDRIELTGATAYAKYSEAGLLALARAGVRLRAHNYFPPPRAEFVMNLSSRDAGIRAATEALVREALRLTALFGADCYSLHAGYALDQLPEPGEDGIYKKVSAPPTSVDAQDETIDRLLALLPPGVKLAVENGLPITDSHLASPAQIGRFLARYAADARVGLLLDLGHLNVAAHAQGFDRDAYARELFDRHGDRIFEVHASANTGERDSHGITPADSAEIRLLAQYAQRHPRLAVTLEWHNCYGAEALARYREVRSALA